MRLFQSTIEMVKEVERDLFEMGIRYQSKTVQDQQVADDPKFQTIELFGYGYTLTQYEDVHQLIEYLDLNAEWVFNEEAERLHRGFLPVNPGSAWQLNREFWEPFLRNGVFAYSYAERWSEQINYVIEELHRRPHTRQAIMTMYDRHQDMMNWGGRDRVPCSVSYQFLIRDNMLHLVYNQRSCDFVKFFGSDVYLTIKLLKHVAKSVGVVPGYFTHFLGSLHAFAGDLEHKGIF
ncbi:hypothetical protein GWN42_26060 [candidate division KSB1 bacterium]|nr:hypothetical protein [candidate division KSB1 bacterium]